MAKRSKKSKGPVNPQNQNKTDGWWNKKSTKNDEKAGFNENSHSGKASTESSNEKQVTKEKSMKPEELTEKLNKMLSEPLLNEAATKEMLEKFREERSKLEVLAKELTDERIALEALKAEAESGFAGAYKNAVEEKETELRSLEAKSRETIEEQKAAFKHECSQRKKDIDARLVKLNAKETALLDQEEELEEQRKNAEAGFIEEQHSAINRYKKELFNAKQKLAELKLEHSNEISSHKITLDSMKSEHLESQRAQVEEDQQKIETRQADLDTKESNLASLEMKLNRDNTRLQARQSAQEAWERTIREEIKNQFTYEINDLKNQLTREKKNVEREQEQTQTLNNEIQGFADLQRLFDNADPHEILTQFRKLQEENRTLKGKQFLDDDDLSEKCEILEEQLADRNDELKEIRVELEETRGDLHKQNISVMKKHHLEQEKRVLEEHKRVLEASIEQLRTQINDLIDRQQGSEAFPALTSLDKKHRHAASSLQPVGDLKTFADQLRFGMASIYDNNPLYYREEDVRLFLGGLAMSNLHILQGMSGTGKTSLAKAFAKVVGGHCTDIAVQAGWRDKDDLLGHYNAFEKRFYEREALQALYRAQLPEYQDRINIILLDEMNLSRPEQYFAEFLSGLEMRPEDRKIVLLESEQANAPRQLLDGRILKIPQNVWFIGTANHDETTNEFADKTYDRAHVMELMRNEGIFNTDAYEAGITYSFESLKNTFDRVCHTDRKKVESILSTLADSPLNAVLENDLAVSWGNRFDRHAYRLLPVLHHAGGSFEEALDHLLATKVFRRGKATGRYDLVVNDLNNVETALRETWELLDWKGGPQACLKAIDLDRKRMERGA